MEKGWDLPYGAYIASDRIVLFNRAYRPIIERRADGTVVRSDPNEWIKHDFQINFYDDLCVPRQNKHTKRVIERILEKFERKLKQ